MRSLSVTSLVLLILCMPIRAVATTDILIGTYEVSYMYNSMYGGGPNGPHNPEGIQYYAGTPTFPIQVALDPATYYAEIVPGRESDNVGEPGYGYVTDYWWLVSNNNPTAIFPQTGYDGGNTAPYYDYGQWWYGVAIWLGTSTAPSDGIFSVLGGLGNTHTFEVAEGQSVWFYWHDWGIRDNLGGVTVALHYVPEPSMLLLLSLGGIMLRGKR